MQLELLKIQTLSIEELKSVAYANVEPSQHERHVELLEKNQEGSLTPEERQELTDLRVAADRLMLLRAYAWSVLRWRGHRIPPLKELPASL
jgi:biotin carboxylase